MDRGNAAFNAILDDIYGGFMDVKPDVAGRHDRETRHPELIIDIARDLDLLPDPARTIRITGSKGKGTTSRMIAQALKETTGAKVALFVSPEEINHNDRMRVNDQFPSLQEFCAIYQALAPHLNRVKAELKHPQYLSPLGIFLLMALWYFKQQCAEYVVLECGRGAEYDEVGQVPSAVGVVTSILGEHISSIGPTLADVARNKLSISRHSDQLIVSEQVANAAATHGITLPDRATVVQAITAPHSDGPLPHWVHEDADIAVASASKLLGRAVQPSPEMLRCSASFGLGVIGQKPVYYDGSVQVPSLDIGFFERLKHAGPMTVFLSLPDDKDGAGVRAVLEEQLGLDVHEVLLTGTRGYLNYQNAQARPGPHHSFHYEDITGFRELLSRQKETIYCIGTQTYIRLAKSALNV